MTTALIPDYTASSDYERIESARRLEPSEYTLHPTLGYVSLTAALAPDEVLAVAYEFTYQGRSIVSGSLPPTAPTALPRPSSPSSSRGATSSPPRPTGL